MSGKMRKAFVIPPELSRLRIEGQVPTATKRESGRVERAFAKPKPPTEADYQRDVSPRLTAKSVIEGLGLDKGQFENYRKFLDERAGASSNETRFRQEVLQKMYDDKLPGDMRRVLADRAITYYRHRQSIRKKPVIGLDDIPKLVGTGRGKMRSGSGGALPDEALNKGEARGGTYYRRITTEKGEHRYYYDAERYHRRDDAHLSGPEILAKREAAMKDKIPGGLASGKKPSDFDLAALAEGTKVEMEHTDSKATAREIAMDHLSEDPNYYRKLKEIEKKSLYASDREDDEVEKGDLTPQKARQILHDGTVHGKPITDQQRKYFGAVASGSAQKSMDAIAELGEVGDELVKSGIDEAVRNLLRTDPTPDDSTVHKLAERIGAEVDDVEEAIYKIAGKTIKKALPEAGAEGGNKTAPKEYREGGATSKRDYADPANFKYPIDTEEHVRAAISYFSKPKNAGVYSAAEQKSIWGRIRAAAKRHGIELGEESGPPSVEKCAKCIKGEQSSPVGEGRVPTMRPGGKDKSPEDLVKYHSPNVETAIKRQIMNPPKAHSGVAKSLDAIGELAEFGDELHKAQSVCEVQLGELERTLQEAPAREERLKTAFEESIKANGGPDNDADGDMDDQEELPLAKSAEGEGSRGGHVIGHTSGGKPIYEVHASSTERYRGHGGKTVTKWIIHDPKKPGGKEYHEYETTGSSPTERRTAALAAHAAKHGIDAEMRHVDFGKREAKQARAEAVKQPVGAGKVRIATHAGAKEMTAHHTAGNYAVHDHPGGIKGQYVVSHVPTGMMVRTTGSKDEAKKLADHMHAQAGDALSGLKFGQSPTKQHSADMDKMKTALGSFQKSEVTMDLDNWLCKAEGGDPLPHGEPGFGSGVEVDERQDGGKVAGVGKNGGGESDGGEGRVGSSRPGPSLADPNAGVSAGEHDKLSEDDADPEKQMTDHEKPIERTTKSEVPDWYQSRYIPEASNELDARRIDAARISQLQKSRDASVYIPPTKAQPAQLQKSELGGENFRVGRGDPQGINVEYSDHLDRYIEKSIQGPEADQFYPHGRPTIGALGNLQKADECPECGLQKSMALSACPHCGSGTAVQNAGVIGGGVLIKSDRPGPVLRPKARGEAVVLPNGIIVVDD